jgi:large subunit ribosomal protein L23
MALLKKTKKDSSASKTAIAKKYTLTRDILIGPRVTEKASVMTEKNAYTFDVARDATKTEISKAIMLKYDVVPVKITTVVTKPRMVFVRGKIGTKSGSKKAMVFLKKGDTIDLAA